MNTRNFVNFHVLISHSPSCLNRDDMNMQKTAIFGGKTRVRISSQSLKRSIRYSDYYAKHFSKSQRTRRLLLLLRHPAVVLDQTVDLLLQTRDLVGLGQRGGRGRAGGQALRQLVEFAAQRQLAVGRGGGGQAELSEHRLGLHQLPGGLLVALLAVVQGLA